MSPRIARYRMLMERLALLALGCLTPASMRASVQRYEIRDSARWDNRNVETQTWSDTGTLGLLYVNGVYVDSIDLAFGLRAVRGGVVFQVVRAERIEGGRQVIDPAWHVYFDGKRARSLHAILPEYSWVYSSPAIIDSVVYYWGVTELEQGHWRLSARRYDFGTREVRSTFLMSYDVATDDPGFLRAPRRDGGGLRFEVGEHRIWLDGELRIQRKEP